MNLSLRAVRSLPLAAALMSGDEVVAATPEWCGPALGCVTYVARGARLLVDTGAADPASVALLSLLLDALEGTAATLSRSRADRVRVLAASLRVLAGRTRTARGTVTDVVALLHAAAAGRTEAHIEARDVQAFAVDDPAVVALIALQVVANAERHDGARTVRVDAAGGVIRLAWAGRAAPATTARRRHDRRRWGLGFARVAADSVGAVVGAPLALGGGEVSVSIDVGVRRLALPVCAVHSGCIRTSTAAWDEETGVGPGAEASRHERVAALCALAATAPGTVVTAEGWNARQTGDNTWIAIPPDAVAARVADVLDGLVHERVLWDGVPLAQRVPIVALAALAGGTAGTPLPRVTAMSWNAAAATSAAAAGYTGAVPEVTGVGAVDPQVVMYLAASVGGSLQVRDDTLLLRVPPARSDDIRLAALRRDGEATTFAL